MQFLNFSPNTCFKGKSPASVDPNFSPGQAELPILNSPEAKFILAALNQRPLTNLNSIKMHRLIELVNYHGITPLIFYRLQEYAQDIPQDTYLFFKHQYLNNLAKNLRFWDRFIKIAETFHKNGIDILPLKGMDMLFRFESNFELRSMTDIDILIKEDQFAKAEKLLLHLGYQKHLLGLREDYWRKKQCHIAFMGNQIMVEVHWGLDFKRSGRIILPKLWERVISVKTQKKQVNIFSPEDAVFSFALHLRRLGNTLNLKQVLDVSQIIKTSPQFDWDYVLKEAHRGKMESTLYFILTQVKLLTTTSLSQTIFKQLGVAKHRRNLIEKFILQHTFALETPARDIYLKAHFLLYDSFIEPAWYVINIPYEQFCRFYLLTPYTAAANIFYHLRLFYIPLVLIFRKARSIFTKYRLA